MPDKEKISFKHIAIEGVLRSGKTKLAKIFAEKLEGQAIFDRGDNPYIKSNKRRVDLNGFWKRHFLAFM